MSMTTYTETEKAVDDLLAQHKVTFETKFVPTPQKHTRIHEYQVHWVITVNGAEFTYQTGIGHLPEWVQSRGNNAIIEVVASGTLQRKPVFSKYDFSTKTSHPAHHPKAASVLYCLISDSDVLDYATFEEWADNYGYNPDSREAEGTYKACIENALKLRRAIGAPLIEELRTLLQDY